ncbi:MAG: ABC transporter permease [Alphaproteobacteria bacterium]|nr:ABC transporter permease [Alphaproteobacteria bacterium]
MMSALLLTVLATSIPLLLAATGELITERAGVLNLGVEGMMLMGAVAALAAVLYTGNPYTGILTGALAGMAAALIFAFFAVTLMTNQVATGLALTIFATGFSGLAGAPLVGKTAASLPPISIPLLDQIPLLGELLFHQDVLFYLAFALIIATSLFLRHSRGGMILRAVGDNHDSAHALGYAVQKVRWMAVAFGGICAGLGGAYIPLVLTPHWSEGMTAGRGWIALALVVFASWVPYRIVIGALIFGGITIMQLAGQARGWAVPSQVLSMLPYLATILALVLMSMRSSSSFITVPACLGKPFHPGN